MPETSKRSIEISIDISCIKYVAGLLFMLSHKTIIRFITLYKYLFNIYRLIHGLFHIALVISTRPWYRPRWL